MTRRYQPKIMTDGRAMVNLGCGDKMHWDWNNLDLSPQARLAHYPLLVKILRDVGVIPPANYHRIMVKTAPDIIVWNLQQGVPFDDHVFDVVYNSHLLEHFDRDIAPFFLKECYRVLKKGGVCRIVVPDLEKMIRQYTVSLATLKPQENQQAMDEHLVSIEALFKDMVERELFERGQTSLLMQRFIHLIFGDRNKLGLSHRWMYDRYSIAWYLAKAGFNEIRIMDAFSSHIEGWASFQLDITENGDVFRPGSLYVEGAKSS